MLGRSTATNLLVSKKIISVLFAILLAGFAQTTIAATIDSIELINTNNPGPVWWTVDSSQHWILGVSDKVNGPLLNNPDSSITGASLGSYYLFANSADLGANPELIVHLSDGTTLNTIFNVSGQNGTKNVWSISSGSNLLSLGWAQGSADLVGTYGGIGGDGTPDLYLKAQIGPSAVPVPAAIWLLGSALLTLTGINRRKKTA